MIKKKAVFIVGAGASKEANMPIGDGLTECIRNSLENLPETHSRPLMHHYLPQDGRMREIYLHYCNKGDSNKYCAAAQTLLRGLPTTVSIDEFLFNHREDSELQILGKSLVAIEIAKAEKKSLLFSERPGNFNRIASTW